MKLYFRLFWLFITQARRSRCSLLGPVDTHFRVLPNDLDVFMHVNNGVYLTLMDLARTDLMLRSDAYKKITKQGWYPVVAAETIRFKRSLKLFQRFTINTRVLGWDDHSIYLEQVFRSKDKLMAKAVVDARFLSKKGGTVKPSELIALINIDDDDNNIPEWVRTWIDSNRQMNTELEQ